MAKIINNNIKTSDDKLLFLVVTDDADTTKQDDDKSYKLRREDIDNVARVFLQSENINVFPCSRRGSHYEAADGSLQQYDPEARLNTERTNRLHTAVNGFTDSFIDNYIRDEVIILEEDENGDPIAGTEHKIARTTGTLIFSLAGYYVEAKNFDPDTIATALELDPSIGDKIYAYLRLKTGVSLDVRNYFTEILQRQTGSTTNNIYLDVLYSGSYYDSNNTEHKINDEFFVGISFVKTKPKTVAENEHYLPLFSYVGNNGDNNIWELVQTSLLPKIEHGETEDSIVVAGNATFKTDLTIKNDLTVENLLTSKEIKVPSANDSDGTTINDAGIQTFYTYTKSLAADGISVGNEISIGNDSAKTTVGAGTLTASELKIDNIVSDSADGLIIEPTTTLKSTLTVEGQTTLNNGLEVTNGDTALQKLTAGSLEVTNNTTLRGEVQIDKKTTINNSLAITGTNNISTPTLKVNTVTSETAVTVDKPLKVNSTLDVNSGITTLHKGLNVKEGLTVDSGATSLKGTLTVTDKATLNNGLEVVAGDATIKSNLKVEDNINVGTPKNPATVDNGGYIVAKKDITAEQDLIAKRDISAGGSATIAGNLTVGTDNNTSTGTINAKKLVKAPTLEATTEAKTPLLTVTNKADITTALNVHNTNNTAKITADKVQIDKDLIVYDTITATKDLGATKNNLNVNKANITTLSSTTATISTINSDDINQKIDNSYYDVPVVFVQQQDSADSNVYQLQIRRANVLPYKTT